MRADLGATPRDTMRGNAIPFQYDVGGGNVNTYGEIFQGDNSLMSGHASVVYPQQTAVDRLCILSSRSTTTGAGPAPHDTGWAFIKHTTELPGSVSIDDGNYAI